MARYNLFKGKSRGSIGDVTFSTQNGIQISRVRNRHPRNPRTNAQMFQRAIWATIIRIYSYGKAIFNTSFESAATPKQSMTAFMSANLDFLRELVITEIENNTPADQQHGRVVHPQSYTPVPIDGLIVSRGTLTDTIFTVTPATEETTLQVSMPAPASATETLTQYAQRIGLTEETTYTIMANIVDKDINILYPVKIDSPYAINYQSYFGAVRLTLKHLLSEKPISQATLADLFDIVRIGNTFTPSFNDIAFGTGTWSATTLLRNINTMGTLAVSAYNTNTQQVSNSAMNWIKLQNTYGIISEYTIPIWGKTEQKTNIGEIIEPEPLPYDYEIEYLEVNENTGYETYIDLGIILESNEYDVFAKFTPLGYPNDNLWGGWFGCINGADRYRMGICRRSSNDDAIAFIGTYYERKAAQIPNIIFGDTYECELYKSGKVIINKITYNSQIDYTLNGTLPFTIFYNNYDKAYSFGRIYYVKIHKNDILIHNFIPVIKDGKGYLYDKISKEFYGALGKGEFTLGPIK